MSHLVVLVLECREGRVVVSSDQDFGESIYRHGLSGRFAVVLLRFVSVAAEELSCSLEWLLSGGAVILEGDFVTMSREGVRFRRPP